MNIYLKKYIKYKKKYYKIKYGGKIENNSIEIFRCYLDILLYKLDIEDKDWSIIRNSNEYKDIKQKYKETTKEPSKHNGFFNNLYKKTPFYELIGWNSSEGQSYATIIYDKYIRVGNENICMPHINELREICLENSDFYKWHDPTDPYNKKNLIQKKIGENIGKKKYYRI